MKAIRIFGGSLLFAGVILVIAAYCFFILPGVMQ